MYRRLSASNIAIRHRRRLWKEMLIHFSLFVLRVVGVKWYEILPRAAVLVLFLRTRHEERRAAQSRNGPLRAE